MGFVSDILGGAPKPPDPTATAGAQTDINRQAMIDSAGMNQINQRGPGYNVQWSGNIGDPNRTMTTTLDPNREALAGLMGQQALVQGGRMGGPIDYSNVSALPSAGGTEGVRSDMFDALMSRIRPDQVRTRRQMETNLANRGIPQGSEAYNDMTESLGRTEQDAQLAAAGQAIGAGQNEVSSQINLNQAGINNVGFDLDQNRQSLAMMLNANPYNQQQVQNPTQYQQAPADIMGATNAAYQAESANYQAGLGGLATLGGAGIMAMSNPSFKHSNTDIASVLPRIDALKVEAWKYKPGIGDGGRAGFHIGPYADQFKELFGIGDGITINLSDANGILFAAIKEISDILKGHGIYA